MTRRRSRVGRLAGPIGAILAIAACGPSPSVAPTATPSGTAGPTRSPSASPSASVTPTGPGELVRVYMVLGFGGQTGLVPVDRVVSDKPAGPEAALRLLLAGPTAEEAAARPAIYTGIPAGIELHGLTVEAGIATVDLSAGFEAPADDLLPATMRLAQVVFTLTRFPDIDAVWLEVDGRVATLMGADGLEVSTDRPFGRDDLLDALPPLFVDEPAWGATISSPVSVSGLANAFEATFELRIADTEGRGVAAGAITASCGTGCWGDFAVDVPFTVQAGGPGVLQVFEESAKDGSRLNLREYPITLVP